MVTKQLKSKFEMFNSKHPPAERITCNRVSSRRREREREREREMGERWGAGAYINFGYYDIRM